MGLLSKAESFSETEKRESSKKGLLAKAALYSESGKKVGLLEKASRLEEAERLGLLEKARFLEEEAPEEGLLKKAEIMARKEEGLLEKVEVVEEMGLLERARRAREKGIERAEKGEERVSAEPVVSVVAKEKKEEITKKKRKKKEKKKSPSELLKDYIKERDVPGLAALFTGIANQKGYEELFNIVLETASGICRAKTGVLLGFKKGRYIPEMIFSPSEMKKEIKRLRFSESSSLVKLMKKRGAVPLKSDDVKREISKRELGMLEPLSPWIAVPMIAGNTLGGFFITGSIPDKARIENEKLLLLSQISLPFIIDHTIREQIHLGELELSRQKEESAGLLALYDYAQDGTKSVKDALDRFSSFFDIETAVLVTGWDRRGGLEVAGRIGLTDEEIRSFRVSKSDRELGVILKKGEPGVPKDVAARVSALSKELERKFKTYIVVPVSFHGLNIAVLIILDMKGAGRKLPGPLKLKLKGAAGFFVPYLLYKNLLDTDPYSGFEFTLEEEIKKAARAKYPLHIITATLKGTEKLMKDDEFERYRNVYERFCKFCKQILEGNGRVIMVNWKRIVLIITNLQPDRVEGMVNRIREKFTQMLKKEQLRGGLTIKKVSYQEGKMSLHELLGTVY